MRTSVYSRHFHTLLYTTPYFSVEIICKNPRSMYAHVPQAIMQFVLKIEKLSHIIETAPILEIMARAYALTVPDGSSVSKLKPHTLLLYKI